jgi:hypothetical protein
MPLDLQSPRYTQRDVLLVTKLKPEVLQTWINRNAVRLTVQNPGSGKSRLYTAMDIVKLAVMRRVADLRMELSVAREFAAIVENRLAEGRDVDWNEYLSFQPNSATKSTFNIGLIGLEGERVPLVYGHGVGDARDMRVSQFTEPFESIVRRREKRRDGTRPMIPALRDLYARQGVHAEPVVIFPLGEIVNGALLGIEALTTTATVRESADGG